MGVVARCERCDNLFSGMIISEHGCCNPDYICENCLEQEDKERREDPIKNITTCNTCYKISKFNIEIGRWECNHKGSWVNWCNRCKEKPARRFNVGGSYDGTNDVCEDCYPLKLQELQTIEEGKHDT